MTVWAIIHSATRVVVGLTSDAGHAAPAGCELVETAAPVLADGTYLLNEDGTAGRATAEQVREAFAGTGLADVMAARVRA